MSVLYYGGDIITMDDELIGEALLEENGLIKAVGSLNELKQIDEQANLYDLEGQCLMPGFIDPHSHFSQVASAQLQISLANINNYQDLKIAILNYIKDNELKRGQWIQANNFDDTRWSDEPLKALHLDKCVADYPLMIQHKSGHFGFLNTSGLRALQIDEQTANPPGGLIGKDQGCCNGYLEENAYFKYIKMIPMPDMDLLMKAYAVAQQYYASFGITTIQEGMLVTQMLPLYDELLNRNLLKLDLVAYPDVITYESVVKKYPHYLKQYQQHLRFGGLKIFLDGSPQGKTAWMLCPYQNEKDYCGYPTLNDDEVKKAMAMAAINNTQLLAHCNGDAAAKQFLECLQECEKAYPKLRDLRPVIIHGQLLRPEQLPLVKATGTLISFFVAHVYYWGDIHIKNFGIGRAAQISCANSALKAKVSFTFHQDAPVIKPNMLETLWCAVNRFTRNGVLLGANERINIKEALKAITINVAYQYHEENEKGTLTPGKKADFVILNQNPLKCDTLNIKEIKVVSTIKDGNLIYQSN